MVSHKSTNNDIKDQNMYIQKYNACLNKIMHVLFLDSVKVNSVVTTPEVRTSGFGIIPGLTPEESALLAAILAALLTLLLLLIPILCCLTPLCAKCGGKKKEKHHSNVKGLVHFCC